MSKLDELKALAAANAAVAVDMNEAEAGGGNSRIIPAGYAVGRMIEYVDFGDHDDTYEGVIKGVKPVFRLGVALFGPGVQDDEGRPLILRSQDMMVKRNEKAGTFLAFKTLNYRQDPSIKHFAQFLGEPYLFYVDNKIAKVSKRNFNSINWAKTLPPIEPISKQFYAVPEVPDELYKLFLWDTPTKEGWDSLFIEGNREDGSSKNFIQEHVMEAANFQGSPIQNLLAGLGIQVEAIVKAPKAAPAAQPVAPGVVAPPAPVAPAVAAPVAPVVTAPVAPTFVAPPAVQEVAAAAAPLVAPTVAPVAPTPTAALVVPAPTGIQTSHSSPDVTAPVLPPVLPVIPGQA